MYIFLRKVIVWSKLVNTLKKYFIFIVKFFELANLELRRYFGHFVLNIGVNKSFRFVLLRKAVNILLFLFCKKSFTGLFKASQS